MKRKIIEGILLILGVTISIGLLYVVFCFINWYNGHSFILQ